MMSGFAGTNLLFSNQRRRLDGILSLVLVPLAQLVASIVQQER
jgi:hypothetical protein